MSFLGGCDTFFGCPVEEGVGRSTVCLKKSVVCVSISHFFVSQKFFLSSFLFRLYIPIIVLPHANNFLRLFYNFLSPFLFESYSYHRFINYNYIPDRPLYPIPFYTPFHSPRSIYIPRPHKIKTVFLV